MWNKYCYEIVASLSRQFNRPEISQQHVDHSIVVDGKVYAVSRLFNRSAIAKQPATQYYCPQFNHPSRKEALGYGE